MDDRGKSFETQVVEIARERWPDARFSGPDTVRFDNPDFAGVREYDGVFITDEIVHVIMCTVRRDASKATEDGRKLRERVRQLRRQYTERAVKGWFITRDEPTPQQNTNIKAETKDLGENSVVAISFARFKAAVVDSQAYIRDRMNYPFGSVQDPKTGSADYGKIQRPDLDVVRMGNSRRERYLRAEPGTDRRIVYVPMDIVSNDYGKTWQVPGFAEDLVNGERFVLLADYGTGKSSTMRQLFLHLADQHLKGEIQQFPVLLNLGEHSGQKKVGVALRTHAEEIGFSKPEQLAKAWNLGWVIMLLDGFDEIIPVAGGGAGRHQPMIRHRAMELVRAFIQSAPDTAGLVVAGRRYYFMDDEERSRAFDVGQNKPMTTVRLNNFNEQQIQRYARSLGYGGGFPEWLPSRPLLLGYLMTHEHIEDLQELGDLDPVAGWDELLTRICGREKTRTGTILTGEYVRRLVERLATMARRSKDGLGPLHFENLETAFAQVAGGRPDDADLALLRRLPGLGESDGSATGGSRRGDDSRFFIDQQLASTAQAGDIFGYIQSLDASGMAPGSWQTTLDEWARAVAASRCQQSGFTARKVSAAAKRAAGLPSGGTLVADIVQVLEEMGQGYAGEDELVVADAVIKEGLFGDHPGDFSGVRYKGCIFERLEIAADADSKLLPRFEYCTLSVDSRLSYPIEEHPDIFIGCEILKTLSSTTVGVPQQRQPIPQGIYVLRTVLDKLYFQSGAGRKESALRRGLELPARRLVPLVLRLLSQEGLTVKSRATRGQGETVWLPIRAQQDRVLNVMSPTSEDPLLKRAISIL